MTPPELPDPPLAFTDALTGRAPVLLRWDLTMRCNLACLHCCVGHAPATPASTDLSTEEIKRAFARAAAAGVAWVHLLGGEPTVREDLLELMAYARGLGLEVSYNTNGIRQGPAFLGAVLALDPISITVSLDGPDAQSNDAVRGAGTFQRAVALVSKLVEARERQGTGRPSVQVQSVLMATWADRAAEMVALAAELGADSLVINNLTGMGEAIPNWEHLQVPPVAQFLAMEQLLDGMRRHPELRVTAPIRLLMMQYWRESTGDESLPLNLKACDAIDQMCHVLGDGSLVPCQMAHDRGVGGELAPPSILDGDLASAWTSPYFRRFASLIKGDLEVVYRDQVPCNRCIFLGRGCRPCPLPALPGQKAVNPVCLMAEGLLRWGRERGGLAGAAPEERLRVLQTLAEAAGGARP